MADLDYFAPKVAHVIRRSRNTTFAWYLLGMSPGLSALAWCFDMSTLAATVALSVLITWPLAVVAAIEGLKRESGYRAIAALAASTAGVAFVWCGLIYVLANMD